MKCCYGVAIDNPDGWCYAEATKFYITRVDRERHTGELCIRPRCSDHYLSDSYYPTFTSYEEAREELIRRKL